MVSNVKSIKLKRPLLSQPKKGQNQKIDKNISNRLAVNLVGLMSGLSFYAHT